MIIAILALITTSPQTVAADIAKARSGDVIRFAPGDYGIVRINGRTWKRPVTFELAKARLAISIQRSRGAHFIGGAFANPGGYAAHVVQSQDVKFRRGVFQNSNRGVVIGRSMRVEVTGSRFTDLTTDGINIAQSQHIVITDNECENFNPGRAHPDCIQGWSRPGGITSDVLVARNTMQQPGVQGIFFGNHVRKGVDDGGYDRITISDNVIEGTLPQGIGLYDCRDCSVTGNSVRRLPGARYRVNIHVFGGSTYQAGNYVDPKPTRRRR
jgi:nitrous oxidase accessory protein NosD